MADQEMTDADKIRAKRLAKLGGSASNNSSASASASGTSAPTASRTPVKPVAQKAEPSASTSKSPSIPQTSKPAVKINITPAKAKPESIESFETWQATALSQILQVTLDREQAEKSSWSLIWLKGLLQELKDDNEPTTLSFQIADRLLIARLGMDPSVMSDDPEELTVLAGLPPQQTSFEFLVGSWKRCNSERLKLTSRKGISPEDSKQRLGALEELRSLIISYAGFNLQDASMFPQPQGKPAGQEELVACILSASSSASESPVLPPSHLNLFLSDLTRRFSPTLENPTEEDMLVDILGPVISALPKEMINRRLTMSSTEWREIAAGLIGLSEIKNIAATFTQLPEWLPNCHPALLETQSLLGPIIRIGCFPDRFPEIAKTWFPSPSTAGPQNTATTMNTLRLSIKSHQESLLAIFNNILKSSPDARQSVLTFFAKSMEMNMKRQGMQVDPRTVAGDSFMINLQAVLLHLSGPFIDAQYSKIDKVDVEYFRKQRRIDMSDETHVHATQQEAKAWEDSLPAESPAPNFISEIFFLTAWSLHLGFMAVTNTFNKSNRRLHDIEDAIREMETDQSWVGTPMESRARAQLEQFKKQKESTEGTILCMQTHLLDPTFVSLQTAYSNFLMTWLVRVVDPKGKHPQIPIQLPLPEETIEAFNMLPEFLFDDVIGFFSFVSRASPELLAAQPLQDLLTFIVVFLSTPYLRNPYIKGKFVEILFFNTRRTRDNTQGALGDAINTNPLALRYLMPALMRIYVDIEMTGHHTQFYDKFNTRFYIAMIFRVIWVNPTHREALHREAARVDQFVRFINLLINDTTYLLDESLTNLTTIHSVEQLKANKEAWEALDDEQRKDNDSKLKQAERTAKMDIQLCNETVRLLKLITEETQTPFCRPEIVDRLASMMNFNLDILAGPKSQDLRVNNMQDFRWQPKVLLGDLLQIYMNLGSMPEFQAAVARDGRSYKKEVFERAANIARRTAIKSEEELTALSVLVDKIEAIRLEDIAEEEMGDVPDEFLDPLTYTIMNDPVILPKAKQSIDKSSIVQHLLSDPRCPFTSTPLTIEECLPDIELKTKIDEFVSNRKAERLKQLSAANATTPMDTS